MVMVNVLDYVQSCYTSDDGTRILELILNAFRRNEKVVVSFEGVNSVTSSFVNAAFIALLDRYSFDEIRQNLTFSNSTKQINDLLKKRFEFEIQRA